MRKLKRGRGRVGLIGKGAGRDEVGFGWRKLELGENPELELTGDRLGAILGGLVRDDVVKLAAGSIYWRSERW